MTKYDSTADTLLHMKKVSIYLNHAVSEILSRSDNHDFSKLGEPEKSSFDNAPHPSSLVFGSDEYRQSIENLRPALEHHYANNSHHPQHYEGGVNDMDLFDVLEMLVDWKASTERTKDGD